MGPQQSEHLAPGRPACADLFAALFIALFGSLFVVIGLGIGLLLTGEDRQMMRATGRVVDYDVEDGRYRAMVEFTTADGERITFVDPVASGSIPLYRMEQVVEVLYSPDSPRRTARVGDMWSSGLWLIPTIFASIGGIFAAIGWTMVVGRLRRRVAAARARPAA